MIPVTVKLSSPKQHITSHSTLSSWALSSPLFDPLNASLAKLEILTSRMDHIESSPSFDSSKHLVFGCSYKPSFKIRRTSSKHQVAQVILSSSLSRDFSPSYEQSEDLSTCEQNCHFLFCMFFNTFLSYQVFFVSECYPSRPSRSSSS